MAFSYNKKNLANTTIVGALSASDTSVTVSDASIFPSPYFYATLMPSSEISSLSNSEIVMVTNISGNVLTIIRAQRETTARSFNAGAVITNGIYSQDLDMAQAVGKKIFNANWDSEAGYYKISDPMLKIVPDEGTSIRAVFDTDVTSGTSAKLSVNENTEGGTSTVIGKNIEIGDANALPPIRIGMYGDTQQTTYSGKNLLGLPDGSTTGGGVTSQTSEGFISITGTPTGNYVPIIRKSTQLKKAIPAGTYVISINQTLPFTVIVALATEDDTQTWFSINEGDRSSKRTLPSEVTRITVWSGAGVEVGTALNITNLGFQLEPGSSATSFEPYVGGTASPNPDYPQTVQTVTGEQTITISDGGSNSKELKVNLGKNLCNGISQNLFLTQNANSAGKLSGNSGLSIAVEQNTDYTISVQSSQERYRVGFVDTIPQADYETVTAYNGANGDGTNNTLTLNSGSHKYLIVNVTDLSKTQIEKGPTATDFAPYFEPIELCNIGTYIDRIYKSNGDWYLRKATNRLNLQDYSGLAWWKSGSSIKITWKYMTIPTAVVPSSMNNAGETYCNHFTNGPAQEVWNGTRLVGYGLGPDGFYFNNNYSTADDFKTYIGNTPVYVYYALATPTDTKITNSALIAQLEALASTSLYEGQNNITVSGDLAGYLDLTYTTINSGVYVANIVNGAYVLDNNSRKPAPVKAGLPYDLTYHSGNWYIMNMVGELAAQSLPFTIANSKVTNSNVKLTFNGTNIGVISGAFKVVGDITYGEELLRLDGKTTITTGTVIGQLFNTDFATPSGASYITITSNQTKKGLNGWNNINCSVVLS